MCSALALLTDWCTATALPPYRRLYTRGFWGTKEFLCIDTGGLMSDAEKLPKEQQVRALSCLLFGSSYLVAFSDWKRKLGRRGHCICNELQTKLAW